MLTARFAAHACQPPDPDHLDPETPWACERCGAVLVVPHSARAPLGHQAVAGGLMSVLPRKEYGYGRRDGCNVGAGWGDGLMSYLQCHSCGERMPNMRALSAHLRERRDCHDEIEAQAVAQHENAVGGADNLSEDRVPLTGYSARIRGYQRDDV